MNETLAASMAQAEIGDVMVVEESFELPSDWHACDGSKLNSHQWPDFVDAMGISGPTFQLPEGQAETGKRVIKVGPSRVAQTQVDPEVLEKFRELLKVPERAQLMLMPTPMPPVHERLNGRCAKCGTLLLPAPGIATPMPTAICPTCQDLVPGEALRQELSTPRFIED